MGMYFTVQSTISIDIYAIDVHGNAIRGGEGISCATGDITQQSVSQICQMSQKTQCHKSQFRVRFTVFR